MADAPKLLRFILVGGSTAAVLLGLTWLFVDGLHLHVTLGSSFALILSGIYNYTLHYYWTFSSDVPHGWVLVKYLLMCMGALIINGLVMHFGVKILPIHYLVVQFLANVLVAAWSFCASSFWVFRRRH